MNFKNIYIISVRFMKISGYREKILYTYDWYLSNKMNKFEGCFIAGSGKKPLAGTMFRDIRLHELLVSYKQEFKKEV